MRYVRIVFCMTVCFLFQACSLSEGCLGPKREVVDYKEETYEAEIPVDIEVNSDFSNLEVYSWHKKEIKFEMTKRLRGVYGEDELRKKLKDIKVDLKKIENKIVLNSSYGGSIRSPADKSLDVRLFVPKRAKGLHFKIGIGTIKVFDDIKCDMNIETQAVNIEINKIEGRLKLKSDMGNIRISGGKAATGTSVSCDMGNINIKAELDRDGVYDFQTGMGNIELVLPASTKANIETVGNLEANEFNPGDFPLKVKLRTGMGKIAVRKY